MWWSTRWYITLYAKYNNQMNLLERQIVNKNIAFHCDQIKIGIGKQLKWLFSPSLFWLVPVCFWQYLPTNGVTNNLEECISINVMLNMILPLRESRVHFLSVYTLSLHHPSYPIIPSLSVSFARILISIEFQRCENFCIDRNNMFTRKWRI